MAKIRPLLLLVVFILLIVSVLKFETQRREVQRQKSSTKNIPEFFLEKSLTTNFSPEGKIEYQMHGDHLEYFKQDDRADIKNSYFIFYNVDGRSWHSRSDTATLFNSRDEISLSGNIRIWQPDNLLEITTETLLLSDSRSIAETSDVINLKSPSGNLRSRGMKADLNTEKLQFFAEVSSEYHSSKEKTVRKKAPRKTKKPTVKAGARAK